MRLLQWIALLVGLLAAGCATSGLTRDPDEPTLHLDLNFQLQILAALRSLCVEAGITVVAVLHDMNLVSLFADRALLLKRGMLRGFGPVSEVINEASIKELLDVDMNAMGGSDSQPRYFVPRQPFSK